MPLTKSGKRALANFKKEYGQMSGVNFFYAYMRRFPSRTKSWHKPNKK